MYTAEERVNVFAIVYVTYKLLCETGAIAQADNKSEILIINNLLSRRDAFNHHIPSIDEIFNTSIVLYALHRYKYKIFCSHLANRNRWYTYFVLFFSFWFYSHTIFDLVWCMERIVSYFTPHHRLLCYFCSYMWIFGFILCVEHSQR